MYKKLSNEELEENINFYYKYKKGMTIKDYCIKNNLNKSQFYYHKKELAILSRKNLYFKLFN